MEYMEMKNWYCIYTKFACEDSVCKQLARLDNIEVFSPKLKMRTYRNCRMIESIKMMFPCYVFVKLDVGKYFHAIKYTRGVRRFVGSSAGLPYIVDISIIDYLQCCIMDRGIALQKRRLVKADNVTITDGPFIGLVGSLLEMKPQDRVMVLLNSIKYQVRVEIPIEFVSAV